VKESCEERLANPSLDSGSRSLYIGREIRGIVSKDMEMDLVTQPDIKMICNGNLFTEFLDSFLVHGCDVPPPPKIKVVEITFESIEVYLCLYFILVLVISSFILFLFVEWKDEASKAIIEAYELCYANAKSKSKSKKSSKKSKRKKDDSDDSDESDSESDSESESDSGSDTESRDEKSDDPLGIDPDKFKWKAKKIKVDKDNSYTIKKLNCKTKYYIRIRAQNQSGWGPYSDIVPVTTKQLSFVGFI
ncbi:hypothetical protein RFI_18140, partial [Reticulomyxa filosa]